MRGFAPGLIRPGAAPWEVMQTYQGVRESGGKNRGPWIDETLAFVNCPPGNQWCCSSFVWCCHRAGVALFKTASVARLAKTVAARQIDSPHLGCGIIHFSTSAQTHGHVLFYLTPVSDTRFVTLSGNTNVAGSREGDSVGRVIHDFDYVFRNGGFFFHLRPEEDVA